MSAKRLNIPLCIRLQNNQFQHSKFHQDLRHHHRYDHHQHNLVYTEMRKKMNQEFLLQCQNQIMFERKASTVIFRCSLHSKTGAEKTLEPGIFENLLNFDTAGEQQKCCHRRQHLFLPFSVIIQQPILRLTRIRSQTLS